MVHMGFRQSIFIFGILAVYIPLLIIFGWLKWDYHSDVLREDGIVNDRWEMNGKEMRSVTVENPRQKTYDDRYSLYTNVSCRLQRFLRRRRNVQTQKSSAVLLQNYNYNIVSVTLILKRLKEYDNGDFWYINMLQYFSSNIFVVFSNIKICEEIQNKLY